MAFSNIRDCTLKRDMEFRPLYLFGRQFVCNLKISLRNSVITPFKVLNISIAGCRIFCWWIETESLNKSILLSIKRVLGQLLPNENFPAVPKLTLTKILTLTRGQFSSGAIVWLPPTLKLTLTLTKTPTLTGGQFSSEGNCLDTYLKINYSTSISMDTVKPRHKSFIY